MARLTTVTAARKEELTCGKCGANIPVGTGYRHWKLDRFTGRRVRCMKPGCTPHAWEMVSNQKTASLMQAGDCLDTARGFVDPIEAAAHLREAIDLVEGVKEEMQAALNGWSGTGLENSDRYYTWESGVSELEEWLDEADMTANDLEAVDLEDEDATEQTVEAIERIGDIPDVEF